MAKNDLNSSYIHGTIIYGVNFFLLFSKPIIEKVFYNTIRKIKFRYA